MKSTDFIMLAKFAKTEEFEIGLEAILWDSDPIDDRLRRQLQINWPKNPFPLMELVGWKGGEMTIYWFSWARGL